MLFRYDKLRGKIKEVCGTNFKFGLPDKSKQRLENNEK